MIYVVGLGSMGRRRVRDLIQLGHRPVVTDQNHAAVQDCLAAYPHQAYRLTPYDEMLSPPKEGDLVLVCTPPSTHVDLVRTFNATGAHVFCEAGIQSYAEITSNGARFLNTDRIDLARFAPSCTMHFHPAMKAMRHVGGWLGTPLIATHHIGQDLHDWHPGADLTKYYAAQEATSGAKEMVAFELFWLQDVVGHLDAKDIRITDNQYGDLGIRDTFVVTGETDRGTTLTLISDVVAPVSVRATRIIYRDHVVTWEGLDTPWIEVQPRGKLGAYQRIDGRDAGQDKPFDFESVYLRETMAVLRWWEKGDQWPMSLVEFESAAAVVEALG